MTLGRAGPLQFATVLHPTVAGAQHFTYRGSGLAWGPLGVHPLNYSFQQCTSTATQWGCVLFCPCEHPLSLLRLKLGETWKDGW